MPSPLGLRAQPPGFASLTSTLLPSALVYTVVLHLKNELNRGSFFMTLQNQPVALSLYRQVRFWDARLSLHAGTSCQALDLAEGITRQTRLACGSKEEACWTSSEGQTRVVVWATVGLALGTIPSWVGLGDRSTGLFCINVPDVD